MQEEQLPITIKDLLESGAHFGHQKGRRNPKMNRFIFEERNGIHIIDLSKTMQLLRVAVDVVKEVVGKRKSILFVGTKKQAKIAIKESAEQCDEFYVSERWLGGMLTNLKTIRQSIDDLIRIEKRIAAGGEGLTKREISELSKEQIKLNKNFSGIRGMKKLPGLLIVVDPSMEHIAVAEAKKLKIPVMAIVDTNCNPDFVDFPIPGNDDALKAIVLIMKTLTSAITQKKNEMNIAFVKGELEAIAPILESVEDLVETYEKKEGDNQ